MAGATQVSMPGLVVTYDPARVVVRWGTEDIVAYPDGTTVEVLGSETDGPQRRVHLRVNLVRTVAIRTVVVSGRVDP